MIHRLPRKADSAAEWESRGAGARIVGPVLLALALAGGAQAAPTPQWVGTWGGAPAPAPQADGLDSFQDQTVRLIVHTSVGGTRVRVRLSNEYGTAPLTIGAVHVALRQAGANIVPGSDRVLTFGAQGAVTLAPGAPVLSDPVALEVPPMTDLAVSLYLPGQVKATTSHSSAFQTSYVSQPGDFSGAATLTAARTIGSWPFLSEVDVQSPAADGVLVTFGDSITDGSVTTTDTNRRWPDLLALRLRARADAAKARPARGARVHSAAAPVLGVVNRGIGGNRLLRDPAGWPPFGKAGLARFEHDVLETAGVRYVVVLLGINDLGHQSADTPPSEVVTARDLIAGYRQLITRAHARGLTIFGATMTPFDGTVFPGYYSPEKDAVREAVNAWIRTSGEYDAVIDFDRAMRDPEHPSRILPAYDSGDHLHPNDRGMQAMADAVPLALFKAAGKAPAVRAGRHAHAAAGAAAAR